MLAFRIGLPATIALAGFVLLVTGPVALGGALLGVAVVVALLDAFMRLGISSQSERDREERARRRFLRTGRWTNR